MRFVALLALVFAATAANCFGDTAGNYGLTVRPEGEPDATGFQLGDTVTFTASEHYGQDEYSDGNPVGPSTTSPASYQWTAANPDLIKVLAPGKIRMLKEGRAVVQVATIHSKADYVIYVVPRVVGVRFEARRYSVGVDSVVGVTLHAIDSTGAVLDTAAAHHMWVKVELDPDRLNPIVLFEGTGPYATEWWSPARLRGKRVGAVRLIGRSRIYRAGIARDTAEFTVR